jgi:hypothetical protein
MYINFTNLQFHYNILQGRFSFFFLLTFTGFIEHSVGSPGQNNQTRERNKGHPDVTRSVKLFSDDMIKNN